VGSCGGSRYYAVRWQYHQRHLASAGGSGEVIALVD
jgi:hypothetical protein